MMNQKGRSMIEMLGVLAIVGVLSVGGIAGYSKAMAKHKINKYMNNLTLMFFQLNELQKGDNDLSSSDMRYFVPKELASSLEKMRFVDIYGNHWGINEHGLYVRMGMISSEGTSDVIYKREDNTIKMTCSAILETAKPSVRQMNFWLKNGSMSICNGKYCTYDLGALDIHKIDEFCNLVLTAKDGNAILYLRF